MIPCKAAKTMDVPQRRKAGYRGGICFAAFLLFALPSAHAALLTESSYLVNPSGSQPGISLPLFEAPVQVPEENPASGNALNLTRPSYSLSFNYAIGQSSGADATDYAGAPIVTLITDMIRASHTFRSALREPDAHNLQASLNLQANSGMSP